MKKATIALFLAIFLHQAAQSQTQYYVNRSTGNDANNGLGTATAWKTVQKAANTVGPNSVVNIMAGTYAEKVAVNVSGAAGQPIVFRNYNADVVVLSGAGTSGTDLFRIAGKNYITVQGLRFTNNQRLDAKGVLVEGACTGIKILGCRFWNINFSADATLPANPNRNAQPIIVYGNSATPVTNLEISGNVCYGNRTGYSEVISLDGNINGFELKNNTVYNNKNIGIDCIGGFGTCPDPAQDFARNGVVSGNLCYGNKSAYATAAGIYVDGARDIVIENNTCHSGQWGIEIGAEEPGAIAQNIVVRNNLLYNNDESGLAVGGYNYPNTGIVDNCVFTGNTLYFNDRVGAGEGEIFFSYSTNCALENNIVSARRVFVMEHGGPASPAPPTLDYNLFFYPGNNANNLEFNLNGTPYTGFADYRTGTGQDANSLFGNPKFVNTTISAINLHLQTSSPAINAGDPSYTPAATEKDMDWAIRKVGARVDIGADETPVTTTLADFSGEIFSGEISTIEVFPNPSPDGIFYLKTKGLNSSENVNLEVFDAAGRRVFSSKSVAFERGINLSGQPKGVYFLKIQAGGTWAIRLLKI